VLQNDGGKIPGKTEFSGRRRITTRKSGFTSHPNSTGGEFEVEKIRSVFVKADQSILLTFTIPNKVAGLSAFGGWFTTEGSVRVSFSGIDESRLTLTEAIAPDWGKFGSIWLGESDKDSQIKVSFSAYSDSYVTFYNLKCGIVTHKHLEWARLENPALLKNMYEFSPEANFVSVEGDLNISGGSESNHTTDIYLKACNRCARFLPINIVNERKHLSFSNHCVAEHRRPCSHSGFGKLRNIEDGQILNLDYGYQLECRFCKKFEVNAAHNPQRTSAQMKEDGARRRAIELLLTELYDGSHQLRFRHEHNGLELSDYIWNKFKRKCFNCKKDISVAASMHLDHTRPLALLWPLDESATCLCGNCNSQKRDRSPVEFYSEQQLEELAKITEIPLEELLIPGPNIDALKRLRSRVDWFYDTFLTKPDLIKERDGKVASELLVRALQKAIDKLPIDRRFNLSEHYSD
jgi:hypothetical protein